MDGEHIEMMIHGWASSELREKAIIELGHMREELYILRQLAKGEKPIQKRKPGWKTLSEVVGGLVSARSKKVKYISPAVFCVYLLFVSTLVSDVGETVSVVITPWLVVGQLLQRVFVFSLGLLSGWLLLSYRPTQRAADGEECTCLPEVPDLKNGVCSVCGLPRR